MKWYFLGTALVLFTVSAVWVWGATVSSTVTTTAQAGLTQADYRWYDNENALTPTSAKAAENSSPDAPAAGGVLRLRMNLSAAAAFTSGLTFKLQFSNSTSSGFADIGTSTAWIFYDNGSVADGATIVTTVLSGSNVGEVYSESNPSAASPSAILSSQKAEWDWAIKNNSADTTSSWYFRAIYSSSTVLDSYSNYPTLTGVTASSSGTGVTITLPGGGGLGFSLPFFATTTKPKPKVKPKSPCDSLAVQIADLNEDCSVDLVDLSIILYYYEREGQSIARYDFNNNNVVDFPDVSVMMFYWTG